MAKKNKDIQPDESAATNGADLEVVTTEETSTEETSTEEVSENPTQKRQRIANQLRKERAAKLEKAAEDAKAKADLEKSASEKKEGKNEAKDPRKLFTDDRGLKFAFKFTAPETLNIDGKSRKTSELIEDEAVMLELVYGNNNHIEQIY